MSFTTRVFALTVALTASCGGRTTLPIDDVDASAPDVADAVVIEDVSYVNPITALAVGRAHACALRADGSVWCWGSNRYGVLGRATFCSGDCESEVARVPSLDNVVQLVAQGNATCALRSDGSVWCWGLDTVTGFEVPAEKCPTSGCRPSPARLAGAGVRAIALMGSAPCVLDEGLRARCFPRFDDEPRPAALDGAIELAGGGENLCGLFPDGAVRCVGERSHGALGYGPGGAVGAAVAGIRAKDIAVGAKVGCALTLDGELRCWGSDACFELGGSASELCELRGCDCARRNCARTPIAIREVPRATAIAAAGSPRGGGHMCDHETRNATCALVDGAVLCWGSALYTKRRPAAVPGLRADVIGVGGERACAARGSTAWCWGTIDRKAVDVPIATVLP